jgi:hypothetical protein
MGISARKVGDHPPEAAFVQDRVSGQVLSKKPGQERLEEAVHVEEEAGKGKLPLAVIQGEALGGEEDLDDRDRRPIGRRLPT